MLACALLFSTNLDVLARLRGEDCCDLRLSIVLCSLWSSEFIWFHLRATPNTVPSAMVKARILSIIGRAIYLFPKKLHRLKII